LLTKERSPYIFVTEERKEKRKDLSTILPDRPKEKKEKGRLFPIGQPGKRQENAPTSNTGTRKKKGKKRGEGTPFRLMNIT